MKEQNRTVSRRLVAAFVVLAALILPLLLLDVVYAAAIDPQTASVSCDAANDIAPPVDPGAGFVTGVGRLTVAANEPLLVWDQGFERDTSGWCHGDTLWPNYGLVRRVPTGYAGVPSAGGSFHAIFDNTPPDSPLLFKSAPYSYNDGFRNVWTGGWTASIDVYLDPDWPGGSSFAYSVAANGADANDLRDFIFYVAQNGAGDALTVSATGNPADGHRVDSAGWYTLQHVFYDNGGVLAADLNLLNSAGDLLYSATVSNPTDLIPAVAGGNRYSWFVNINVPGGLAVDNQQLTVIPSAEEGRLNFAFSSRYNRNGTRLRGNAQFTFRAGDVRFRSTEYRWLVVDADSGQAQFSGIGKVNGELAPTGEPYRFTVWLQDGDPDLLRVKIWWENNTFGRDPTVVFDNGALQPIARGNLRLRVP